MDLRIYFDLDGVCCDFVRRALSIHGKDADLVFRNWKKHHLGVFEVYNVISMSKDEFWDKVWETGSDFWISIPEYPWFREMIDCVVPKRVYFSTATGRPEGAYGKIVWIKERMGNSFNKFMISRHKYLLANDQSVLIDDREENVYTFRKHGGRAILFPQLWNIMYKIDVTTHSDYFSDLKYVLSNTRSPFAQNYVDDFNDFYEGRYQVK